MENAVDKNFDKLEIWTLRNVLCLPRGDEELARWVRLRHYDGVDVHAQPEHSSAWTPERLYTLRRKLLDTQRLNAALVAEKTRNQRVLAQLTALLSPAARQLKTESTSPAPTADQGSATPPRSFAFLTHSDAAANLGLVLPTSHTHTHTPAKPLSTTTTSSAPLTTHTSFSTSQLPYLRQLLAALTPHLASTALPANPNSPSESAESSRERKLYLESQSKRILERRGVDTREGVEGAVEGVRVRADEVRALEGIVEALGRGNRGGGGAEEAMDTS